MGATSEAAARSGVPEDTLRARRREGIVRLRRRLDTWEQRSADWRATLAAAFGAPLIELDTAGSAAGGAGGTMTLLGTTLMTWRITAAAVAVSIAIGFAILRGGEHAVDRVIADGTVESAPEEAPDVARLATPAPMPGARLETPAQGASEFPATVDSAPTGARLFVVDSAGTPLADARAIWIPREGSLTEIRLGPDGSGALPPRGRVTASCADHRPAFADIDGTGGDLTIVLLSPVPLRGRVIVDGGPPTRPIRIERMGRSDHLGLSVRHYMMVQQRNELRGLGIDTETEARTITEPDGSFAFPGVSPAESGLLYFPDSFRIAAQDSPPYSDWPLSIHAAGDNDLVIHLTQLPTLHGRLIWADDGTPLQGEVQVGFNGGPDGEHPWRKTLRIWDGGRFEIGVVRGEANGEANGDLGDPIILPVEVDLLTTNGLARDRRLRFDLDGRKLPLDLGVLEIERADVLHVHVEDRGGKPVGGAVVAFDRMGYRVTGDTGDVLLAPGDAADLLLSATGYVPRRVSIAGLATTPGDPLTVRLNPAPTLCIAIPDDPALTLNVECPPGSILHGQENDEDGFQWLSDIRHDIFQDPAWNLTRAAEPDGPWTLKVSCVGVPFTLGPLRPGAVIEAVLVNDAGEEVARQRVDVPLVPGTSNIDLR